MSSIDNGVAEELALGYADPLRFVLWAFPWGDLPEFSLVPLPEPWASRYPGCRFGPDKWACELLDEIGQQVRENAFDGVHAVPPIRHAISSGHGIGKLQPLDTVIPTPYGFRRFGDLKPGDYVFGSDGNPTKIVGIPYRGVRPCYRVTFDDGSSTIVGREHLWTVRGRQGRRKGSATFGQWETLETQEIIERGVKRKNGKAMARQWEVPRHGAISCSEADLPVYPYLLGLWLGDGTCGKAEITTDELESVEILEALRTEWGDVSSEIIMRPEREGSLVGWRVRFPGEKANFEKLEVFHCRSYERFIPDEYKFSSPWQRLELLRGLIDTDAEVGKRGSVTYSSTSERLIDDVMWLVRSLGGKAQRHPTVKKAWYPNKDTGERVYCRPCYLVTLTMPPGVNLAYAPHKADRVPETIQDRYLTRWIDSIEYVGDLEGQCISVEAEDGLYLTNDFIVTHNSAITAMLVVWILATRPGSKGVVTANTASQLETKTFAEISKWLKRSLVADMFDVKSAAIVSKEAPEAWRLDAQTCREENSESFAGQHSASSTSFYIFDESSAVPDVIWEVAEGGLTDGEPMMFVFGNPTRNSGRFRECFGKRKEQWRTRQIDSRDVFITNKQQIENWRKEYGENSDFFRVRVKGEFPNASSMQFIPTALAEEAARRELPHNPATAAIIGVDVARFGDDDSVIYVRIGRGFMPIKRYRGLSTTQLVSKVKTRFEEVRDLGFPYNRIFINVDEGGVGGGPKDMLRDDGYPVYGVQFGAGADDKETYNRKREEMWGRMKLWLSDGGTLPNDRGLIDDLTAPEYDILPGGQVKLESKKDMKKRGLSSPDSGDALALTFARKIEEYLPIAEIEAREANGTRRFDPFACLNQRSRR